MSPWPKEFGLGRIRALLEALGSPHRSFDSIHVVGSNGKSTATRTIAELSRAAGRRAGAYTSPHVSGWAERIWADGEEADFEQALARVRKQADRVRATQFEALTAAAFAEFAAADVEVAAVEAGLGGRLDATNVVDAPVVLLTNVTLEHADVLGETPEEIAREKLAVAHAARVVVLSDNAFVHLVPQGEIRLGGAREAAEAYLGRPVDAEVEVNLPGRFERRNGLVLDGAHTPEAAEWLLSRLPDEEHVLCVSILSDKDADGILARLARAGNTLVATRSSNDRALDEKELGRYAEPYFQRVETVADPREALERAQALGPRVLVTGSLYLLADLKSSD
ncbi:MAG TPA: Mur ligase family protein [Gaiellaceae bacterium]|nr:Mur ligase family protein [Gaiellaceae bacterium]